MTNSMFSHHPRHVPAPPRECVSIHALREEADTLKARYEATLDARLRLAWLTLERHWVTARNEAQALEPSLCVELLDAEQAAALERGQPCIAG